MHIPYANPDPASPPLCIDYPREDGLEMTDFIPQLQFSTPAIRSKSGPEPYWQFIANQLLDSRNRFAAHNSNLDNPRCSSVDRSAVLAVYNEALTRLQHVSRVDALKINVEVTIKVMTILDLRGAEPTDSVFYTKNAFLSPLEPQYAKPRLNYYNRGTDNAGDSYYYHGYRRLSEWRKEGWPHAYPEKAVERERKERDYRRRKGRELLRETDPEGLQRIQKKDAMKWGDEVDADPERPWK